MKLQDLICFIACAISVTFILSLYGFISPVFDDARYGDIMMWVAVLGIQLLVGLVVVFHPDRYSLMMKLYPVLLVPLCLLVVYVNRNPFYQESFTLMNVLMCGIAFGDVFARRMCSHLEPMSQK